MKKLVIAVFTAISIALLIVKVASAKENKSNASFCANYQSSRVRDSYH